MCQNFLPFQGRMMVHFVYIPHGVYLFIHQCGCLCCLSLLAIMNGAAVNTGYKYLFQPLLSTLLGIHLVGKLMDLLVIL